MKPFYIDYAGLLGPQFATTPDDTGVGKESIRELATQSQSASFVNMQGTADIYPAHMGDGGSEHRRNGRTRLDDRLIE